jgi:Tol biopolymer transport system component
MLRQMILLMFAISIVLSIDTATAQETPRYLAYVAYEDIELHSPTAHWLNLDTWEVVEPPQLEGSAQCPEAWSPDGQSWVYEGLEEDQWTQYILDVETGESRAFANLPSAQFAAWWSPNSALLAYATDEEGATIAVYDRRRGSSLPINDAGGNPIAGRWTSDTEFIYIASHSPVLYFYTVNVPSRELDIQQITMIDSWFNYAIAPDFTGLVANHNIGEGGKLYLYQWGNEEGIQLGEDNVSDIYPAWSPDSQRLAYFTHGDSGTGLRIQDIQTGEIQVLTEMPNEDYEQEVKWSPDGTHLLVITYTPEDTIEYAIWDLETNESREIVIDGTFFRFESESQWVSNVDLVFTASPSTDYVPFDLYGYNLDTEDVINLTNSPTHEYLNCVLG